MTITETTKLKLKKPDNDELTSPLLMNANLDILDKTPGLHPVSSGTRPTNPYLGQRIIEQDKRRILRWAGSQWVPVWPKPICQAGPAIAGNTDYPTAGVWQKLLLQTPTIDNWEMIDSANNRMILPWNGTYQFNAMWHSQGNINAGFLFAVSVFKNDVFWAQFNTFMTTVTFGQTPGPVDFAASGLKAGDFVDFRAYFDVNLWDIHTDPTNSCVTRLCVQYLGG